MAAGCVIKGGRCFVLNSGFVVVHFYYCVVCVCVCVEDLPVGVQV